MVVGEEEGRVEGKDGGKAGAGASGVGRVPPNVTVPPVLAWIQFKPRSASAPVLCAWLQFFTALPQCRCPIFSFFLVRVDRGLVVQCI